ncbi:hypothetical protein [Saccharicrinis sp. GN24d3]|uniref:hypothetical protein n=1 Tax=Saccharicrinis sp. GN24d3 TaxID=3458416 RepID=UPI0040372EA7
MKTLIPFLIFCVFISSCKVYEKVPSVRFQGPKIESVQTGPELKELKLNVNLRFLFTNPLNMDIVIPAHDFNLKINNKPFVADVKSVESFVLKGKTELMKPYNFEIALNQETLQSLHVLGRDNYLEFLADVKIDLADYGIKIPTIFGRQVLRNHTLTFSYGDTLRFPLMPEIRKITNKPARVVMLGEMETINLEIYKDAFAPFVSSIIDAEFSTSSGFDFIQQLEDLGLMDDIGFFISGLVLLPGTPDSRREQWENFVSKVKDMDPSGKNIMDHFVKTYAKPVVGNQVVANWNTFKQHWGNFVDEDLLVSYPGKNIYGIKVEIPFKIYNPNYFPVEAPSFFNHFKSGNWQPLLFQAVPKDGNTTIKARSDKEMSLTMQLDWSKSNEGILDFITGNPTSYKMEGETKIDLGYGPMTIVYELPLVPIQPGVVN